MSDIQELIREAATYMQRSDPEFAARLEAAAESVCDPVEGLESLVSELERARGWLPMDDAPKDRPILGLCCHEADKIYDEDSKTMTTYGAHAEIFGRRADNGPHVLIWGMEFYEQGIDGGYIPEWWFVNDGDLETVANPIAYMEIPDYEESLVEAVAASEMQ